jgi:hypothetical protein
MMKRCVVLALECLGLLSIAAAYALCIIRGHNYSFAKYFRHGTLWLMSGWVLVAWVLVRVLIEVSNFSGVVGDFVSALDSLVVPLYLLVVGISIIVSLLREAQK